MFKTITIGIIGLLVSASAEAKRFSIVQVTPEVTGAQEGLNAAEKMCQDIGFPNDVMKCMQVVAEARYFEKGAVGVCKDLSFSNQKLECLQAVRNKVYSDTAVQTCKGLYFQNKIVDCFNQAGRPYIASVTPPTITIPAPQHPQLGPASADYMRRQIIKALRQLEEGNLKRAKVILKDLLLQVSE